MKRIILLILISISAFGQARFPEGVRISGGQPTVTSTSFLTATDATGLQTKIAPVNLPFALSTDLVWSKSGNNIYNNNTGKVGIGISSPQTNLDVLGSTRSSGDITSNTGLAVGSQDYQVTYTSPNLTDTEQGYTFDGTYHYMIGTNIIKKLNSSWTVVAQNTNPLSGITGVNHLGDGFYLSGFIYAPAETYPAVTGMKIAKYNAATLALVATYDISAQNHECSSMTTDGTTIYISSYLDGSKIWKYDLVGNYLGFITISSPFTNNIQGISLYNGEFYVVEQANLSKLSLDGSVKTFLRVLPGNLAEPHRGEGVQVVNGEVRILIAGLGLSTLNVYYLNPLLSTNKLFYANSLGETTTTKITVGSSTSTPYTSVLAGTMVFGNRASGIAPMIITRNPFPANTGFLNVAMQNSDVIRTGESDMVFRTAWESGGVLQSLTTAGSAFSFQNASVNIVNILRSGATTFAGNVTTPGIVFSTIPVTSASTFDILTRNSGSSVVEKILSTSIEYSANKQNSLVADVTNTKYPTVTAVNAGIAAATASVRPYKVYSALIAQSGTSAPTVLVLENTTGGTVSYTYNAAGDYTATITGASFTANKTMVPYIPTTNPAIQSMSNVISTTAINIKTQTAAAVGQDAVLAYSYSTFEIRIYP